MCACEVKIYENILMRRIKTLEVFLVRGSSTTSFVELSAVYLGEITKIVERKKKIKTPFFFCISRSIWTTFETR